MSEKIKMNWKKIFAPLILPAALFSINVYSHENDDPILANLMIDKFEIGDAENSHFTALEAQAWVGKDVNKFWLKTNVEHYQGETEQAEVQALYSHAIAPFWDIQMGVRQDIKSTPTRTWGVIGVQGLAPYFFEVDAALFIGESGHTAARITAEYDLRFTQRLILSPQVEMNLYGQTDRETGTGSGLSDINVGLRLRYEIRRELAPYIGIDWSKQFGASADLSRNNNEITNDTKWVIGVRAWF